MLWSERIHAAPRSRHETTSAAIRTVYWYSSCFQEAVGHLSPLCCYCWEIMVCRRLSNGCLLPELARCFGFEQPFHGYIPKTTFSCTSCNLNACNNPQVNICLAWQLSPETERDWKTEDLQLFSFPNPNQTPVGSCLSGKEKNNPVIPQAVVVKLLLWWCKRKCLQSPLCLFQLCLERILNFKIAGSSWSDNSYFVWVLELPKLWGKDFVNQNRLIWTANLFKRERNFQPYACFFGSTSQKCLIKVPSKELCMREKWLHAI